MKTTNTILFALLLLFVSCNKENTTDYTEFVNPFIGTSGHGHTFPGATAPYGMVQLSPDTRRYGWDACSGYHYTDSTINGFSHTHLSGTGIGDYGDILVMPIVGKLKINTNKNATQQTPYASTFRKKSEKAQPGYYEVQLDSGNIKVQLTASPRVGMHQYTYPKSDSSAMLIDMDYAIYQQEITEMKLQKISDTEIVGYRVTKGWAPEQRICFYAQTSKPFYKAVFYQNGRVTTHTDSIRGNGKVLLLFKTKEKEKLKLKVGLSSVDWQGGKRNLTEEIPDWDFDRVRIETRKRWNHYLAKIDVKTKNRADKETFYTALYHTAVAPNIYSDVDGRYMGVDGKIHQSQEVEYTLFSLWDTYRALHPLLTVIGPEQNEAFIRSLLTTYQEGGILPMWELARNYTATMIGYHAVAVIADAYVKGYRNFDTDLAFQAVQKSSSGDTANIVASPRFKIALSPLSKRYKNEIGFIPCDKEVESVAKGLEYAYNDWCILQIAKDRKDSVAVQKYTTLAQNYNQYFDTKTKFMRGKQENGKWRMPFNPRASKHRSDDYCEGTAWQWLWYVPHDIDGLVKLLGGEENFEKKLDALFAEKSTIEGDETSVDISGLIGQYAHGNEPSHHIAHLYNYIGKPHKTQALIDTILKTQYNNTPSGLSGNEDCGQMSAWYILNAIGFYQVCPGNPTYSIGRPIFDKVRINLPNGKQFVIISKNNTPQNKYIQSIKWNNKILEQPFFTHSQLTQGGRMEIVMTPKIEMK